MRRVAVLPFAGPAGEQVSLELEGMLAQATIDGHPYFTISDRHTLQNAMNELKLRSSGLTDEQSAIRLGKFLGADGIYTGTIIVPPVTRQTHTEDRYSCPSNGKKLFSACQSPTKTTVTCT